MVRGSRRRRVRLPETHAEFVSEAKKVGVLMGVPRGGEKTAVDMGCVGFSRRRRRWWSQRHLDAAWRRVRPKLVLPWRCSRVGQRGSGSMGEAWVGLEWARLWARHTQRRPRGRWVLELCTEVGSAMGRWSWPGRGLGVLALVVNGARQTALIGMQGRCGVWGGREIGFRVDNYG